MPLAKDFKFPQIPIPPKESVIEHFTEEEYEDAVKYLKEAQPALVIPGVFITPSLNVESYLRPYIIAGDRLEHRMYQDDLNYGLCDQYEQIIEHYKINEDSRNLIILIVPLDAREINWDKWGEYIGVFRDPLIVYTYTIYEVR